MTSVSCPNWNIEVGGLCVSVSGTSRPCKYGGKLQGHAQLAHQGSKLDPAICTQAATVSMIVTTSNDGLITIVVGLLGCNNCCFNVLSPNILMCGHQCPQRKGVASEVAAAQVTTYYYLHFDSD